MTQPSGWYDDPSNPENLRYFDGILWTDNVVPKVAPAPQQWASPPPAAPAPGGYPWGPAQQHYANPGQQPYGQPPANLGYGTAPQLGWAPAGPSTPDGVPLAQWWQRLLAAFIDNVILGVLTLAASFPLLQDVFTWYLDQLRAVGRGVVVDSTDLAEQMTDRLGPVIVPATLIGITIAVIYTTVFLVRSGGTPGKIMVGIRVRALNEPGPPTLGAVLKRQAIPFLVQLLSVVPLVSLLTGVGGLLDNLWLTWDPRRQALHDKLAGTVVVQKQRPLR